MVYLSAPKKKKLARIVRFLGDTSGKTCIDIGSDNGVISLFLRRHGGKWFSTDIDDETVRSIRNLVGERVFKTDGRHLPFSDSFLDAAVIVDLLEHLEDDMLLIAELRRVLKPGGILIINVPFLRNGSVLKRIGELAGYTDEQHGHLRPGYTPAQVKNMLKGRFRITDFSDYQGFFTELLDTFTNIIMYKSAGQKTTRKGSVMTGAKSGKNRRGIILYRKLSPILEAFTSLDVIFPSRKGTNLIFRATCLK